MATNLDTINTIIKNSGPVSRDNLSLFVEKCLRELRWSDTIFAVRTYLNVDLPKAEAVVFALYPRSILSKNEIDSDLRKSFRDHIKYSKEKPFITSDDDNFIIDKDRAGGVLSEVISARI